MTYRQLQHLSWVGWCNRLTLELLLISILPVDLGELVVGLPGILLGFRIVHVQSHAI